MVAASFANHAAGLVGRVDEWLKGVTRENPLLGERAGVRASNKTNFPGRFGCQVFALHPHEAILVHGFKFVFISVHSWLFPVLAVRA